jgi:S1-C subfamily serine protease
MMDTQALHSKSLGPTVWAVVGALALLAAPVAVHAQTISVSGSRGPVEIVRPTGYIGIVYSGDQRIQVSQHQHDDQVVQQRVLVSYTTYPVIVSVEQGSPAARAGLMAGDTVLSYNGKDVREPFALYDLLKPGTRINMRIRREGRARTIPVTVAARPASFGATAIAGNVYVSSPEIAEQIRREVERAQAQVKKELEANRELTAKQREEIQRAARVQAQAEAQARVRLRATPAPPAPPAPVVFAATASGVAGAEMTPLNDHLAELVGLRRGVFVVKVNPGTPAEQSGLRGGDVITAVGDSAVYDVAQLRRAINAEQRRIRTARAAREIPLEIVRKHRKQKLVLKF